MKKRSKNIKGITLVALVVTVIILMILAGITLTLVLGQDGLIGEAKKAKEVTANSDKATEEGLNNLYNEMVIATKVKSQVEMYRDNGAILSTTDNTQLKDDNNNIVTVPAGFKIASDSAINQDDGIVIEDKDGNQFVWIPVTNISNYARTDFGSSYDARGYSLYLETMPTDEQTSVTNYHGYYIGRCEAGDNVSTTNKTLRASGANVTNQVTIKKGQATYNYVTIAQAKTLSEGMKTAEGYKATTKLCSSYAWDTATNFIQKNITNYGTSSPQGNYNDTTFNYIDITGTGKTKASGSNILVPTGQTTPVNNIYDMGGNDWEWTTEIYNNASYPCFCRGGGYYDNYSGYPAGYRYYGITTTYSSDDIGFRITLYL